MRNGLSSVNPNCYSLIRVAVLPEKFDLFDYGTKLNARMDEENWGGVWMDFVRRWRCGVDAKSASAMRSSSPRSPPVSDYGRKACEG
jgi:hypothetical protein